MKKILFFAFALVASVLAFTSCNKEDKNEPTVQNPLVGTWTYQTPVRDGQQNVYTFIFDEKNNFSFEDLYYQYGSFWDGRLKTGTYDIDKAKSIVTLHYTHTKVWGRGPTQEGPYDEEEQIKYEIKGDTLNVIRGYGSEHPRNEQYIRNGKPADQDDPSDINIDPTKLINTEWRTDSCFMNGQKTQPPHLYIRILSEDAVIMNGENHNFVINGDKMTCTFFDGMTFTFVEVSEGWAHVKGDNGSDIYLSKLPARDYEAMIHEHQESDFLGTWKLAYFTYNNHTPGYEMEREGTNPGTETWEFKADGSCIYYNWLQDETVTGSWECDPYQIKFSKNPAEGIVIAEGEPITVQPLTPNWMCILRSPDGWQYYYWWFYRVK